MKKIFLLLGLGLFNIAGAQNVGINRLVPTSTLHVGNGNVRIEGPAASGGYALSVGGYGTIAVDAPGISGGRLTLTENSKLGIGMNNPGFPLNFATVTGDKISLWGNSGSHYGIGIQNNLIQIHTDGPAADIAFGYGSSESFAEKLRIKGTGALQVNGNVGQPGQFLKSNGNAPPEWKNNPVSEIYNRTEEILSVGPVILSAGQTGDVPGLTKTLNLSKQSKVVVRFMINVTAFACSFCGLTTFDLFFQLNNSPAGHMRYYLENDRSFTFTGERIFTLPAGSHNIKISALNVSGPQMGVALTSSTWPSSLTLLVIPQE